MRAQDCETLLNGLPRIRSLPALLLRAVAGLDFYGVELEVCFALAAGKLVLIAASALLASATVFHIALGAIEFTAYLHGHTRPIAGSRGPVVPRRCAANPPSTRKR